jgi:hypothetical protein
MKHYAINTEVEWEWGNGNAIGNIREKFTSDVERSINGSSVKREASESDPAYLMNRTMAVRF